MYWPYAKSIVPVPSTANIPMQEATFACNKNKIKYFSRLTIYSVIISTCGNGRVSFLGRTTFRKHGQSCNKIIPNMPYTKITKKTDVTINGLNKELQNIFYDAKLLNIF